MRRRALLLAPRKGKGEIEELLYSAGFEVAGVVSQSRSSPDPRTFLGKGKLEEAWERARDLAVDALVFDGDLTPGQWASLGRFARERSTDSFSPELYDRLRLILEIFRERAQSPEARLEVEYAELRYRVPIVRELVHRAKMGERPGFLAGGAYGVEAELDRMRARMARIRKELSRLQRERAIRRKHRRRAGFDLVALAGYTNAGKSSLLKALSGEDVLIENRYFSTLATRTGRARGIQGRAVLLTDTVGFIDDLPPWIVEAFHSTLEEIALSDLVLLVADSTDPLEEIVRKIQTGIGILQRFSGQGDERGFSFDRLLVVLTKRDLLPPSRVRDLPQEVVHSGVVSTPPIVVSSVTGEGLSDLIEALLSRLSPLELYEVHLPLGSFGEIEHLRSLASVKEVRIERGGVRALVEVAFWSRRRVGEAVERGGGTIERIGSLRGEAPLRWRVERGVKST